MSDNTLNDFINKKKADSKYIELEDGESAVILKVTKIEPFTKPGYDGMPKDVIRLTCDVDTEFGIKSKWFDNGTQRFAETLMEKNILVGMGFTLSRTGEQAKTRYTITNITGGAPATPPATQATIPPTPPTGATA